MLRCLMLGQAASCYRMLQKSVFFRLELKEYVQRRHFLTLVCYLVVQRLRSQSTVGHRHFSAYTGPKNSTTILSLEAGAILKII